MHELLQHYQILERLRRATKGGKFSRAACREFAFVLNLRQREIPKQKNYPNLSHRFNIYSILRLQLAT